MKRKRCAEIGIDARFANMPIFRCDQKVSYCRRLQNAIDLNMDVEYGYLPLRSWLFDKLYTSLYLMHGGSHRTSTMKFEVRQRTAPCSSSFACCHPLKLFAVLPRERLRYHVHVAPSWRELETDRMICVPTLPRFAKYLAASGNGSQPFGRLLCKTTATEFTVMSFVCFVWAAEFEVLDFFLPSRFCALCNEGRLRANERVFIPLSRKMRANVTDGSLYTMICNCEVDAVLVLLPYPRMNEIDRSVSEALG